ncbi:MAG: Ltp family lipoprotein [Corynebacterium flavescens]|nr:Ltp family lipoprotein [Corynebacterium flavescens]
MSNPYQSPIQNQSPVATQPQQNPAAQQFAAQSNGGIKPKKPIWKKWWFWIIAVVAVFAIFGSMGEKSEGSTSSSAPTTSQALQANNEAQEEAGAGSPEEDGNAQPAPAAPAADVPREYKSALKKAGTYSKMMHMSQQGIYDQLTSEYGEGFSPDAAQYAIENLDADYNAAALEKAKSYQDNMSMSPSAIYDQLTSEYGEKFTAEEAQHAVDNLPQ